MEYWMIRTAPKDSKEPGIDGGLLRTAKQYNIKVIEVTE